MDITTDGFGYMLNVGDLAWVPFVYTLQARYLAFNPVILGTFWTVVIFTTNAVGYYIFRSSNNEKDEFRKGKNPKSKCRLTSSLWQTIHSLNARLSSDLLFMKTERGTKLLISGWWGWLQHPNYLYVKFLSLAPIQ